MRGGRTVGKELPVGLGRRVNVEALVFVQAKFDETAGGGGDLIGELFVRPELVVRELIEPAQAKL